VASRGVWRSLVACFVRDEEVVGSNPATPTTKWQRSRQSRFSGDDRLVSLENVLGSRNHLFVDVGHKTLVGCGQHVLQRG
jgi:hypothetical protein